MLVTAGTAKSLINHNEHDGHNVYIECFFSVLSVYSVASVLKAVSRLSYWRRIESKNSALFLVALILSSRNSIASRSSML